MRVGWAHRSWTAACAVVVLAGCGGSGKPAPEPPAKQEAAANIVQPGAPGESSRKLTPSELESAPRTAHTAADVAFMYGMIHHHQQAIVMTGWVPERTASPGVKLLAERMGISQQAEIELMQRWLEDRGVDPSDHTHQHTRMPGMLNTRQLERLRSSHGRTFDRWFLRYMTMHHRGALTMVQDLYAKGGGMEPNINAFTRSVDSDQSIEIQRMQTMLRKL